MAVPLVRLDVANHPGAVGVAPPSSALGASRIRHPVRGFRAHPKPQWVRQELIRLKALMPEAGCRTIAHGFNRRFGERRRMTVGKTYVADTLRRTHKMAYCCRRSVSAT